MAYLEFGKGGSWRARGARAYSGGLGAEPPAGSRAEPLVGPPKADTLFASECSIETANLPIFLKFGNAKDHQTLLNFAILAEKWQKRTFSYEAACKKFSWSGQRGGASHRAPPPLNTPLVTESAESIWH